ncbi:MAG: ABC transporter ATP-binding protein [Aquisalinus sp.]|nr:ABC transporter ATP-binding protein [Aquisalinus sp.]
MTEIALKADSLSVSRGRVPVLSDITFDVSVGEVFALLGGNGAGKSTTLLTFLGFLPPRSGSVTVLNKPVTQNVEFVRQKSAYLPEAANLYPHLNARENIKYFLSLAKVPRSASDIEAALDEVSLATEARGRRLSSYSKGMRQKVAISLAILRQAPVLFLDEPTSGLDPVAIDEFNQLITKLSAAGTTVLMVTHDVYGACQIAGRVGLLKAGSLVGVFEAPEGGQISPEEVHRAFAEGA